MNNLYDYNKRGTRMLVDTDYKKFNKQTNYITYGNVISGTQYSNYIRGNEELENYGNKFEFGELRNYDLKFFIPYFDNEMSDYFRQFTEKCCLYEFYTYNKEKREKEVIGWLVFDYTHTHLLKYHVRDNFKYQNKGKSVLDLMNKIIYSTANKVRDLKGVI